MNKITGYITGLVIVGALGYVWGRYKTPAKIEIQEKQTVVKETEVIVREVVQKDGTVIKERITKDTSTKASDKSNKTTFAKPKNKVTIVGGYNFQTKEQDYGIHYQRRIGDSPFFGGVYGTKQTAGISLGAEF